MSSQCQVVISERGKVLLEINGFKFRKCRDLTTGETSWRCCKSTCSASMKTRSADYTITDTKTMVHNHEPLPEKVLARQRLSGAAKRKAKEQMSERPTKILQTLLDEQNCQVLETPDLSRIKRNIYNARRKLQCQVIISERGKVLLEINGFKFRKSHDLDTGETSWRCCKSTCGASMKTKSADYTITDSKTMIHNHEPLTEKELARQRLSGTARRKAQEQMSERPTKILQSLLKEPNSQVVETRDLSTIKRNMYNVRQKLQCHVISSERGKVLLEINGFKFRKSHDLETGETSWRCCKSTCGASMKTKSADYTIADTKMVTHNHEPLTEKELARQRLSEAAKRKAKELMSENPTKILESLRNEQNFQVLETRDLSKIKRNIYNVRQKLQCPVIISEQGKMLLEINRYKFRKRRDLETGETSWRCCKNTCGASMKTRSSDHTITDTKMMVHNHEPVMEKNLARQRLSGAAKRKPQKQMSERPTKILQSMPNEQNCQVLETPDLSEIKTKMCDVQEKLQCQVIISERGKVLLEINGFKFRKCRDLGTGETSWRCSNSTCGASMKTTSADYTITETKMMIHSHEPLTEKQLARQRLSEAAKRKAKELMSENPTKILESLLSEQNCQVLETRDLSKIKRNMYNVRRKSQPKLPQSIEET